MKRYLRVLYITIVILVLEILGGLYSGSLALLADAMHVFQDSIALLVAMLALFLIKRVADDGKIKSIKKTAFFILLALLSFTVLWMCFEAMDRYVNPNKVEGIPLIVIAFIGAIGNYVQHKMLDNAADEHKDHTHKGIALHIKSDLYQSLAVIIGGFLIILTGIYEIDTILTFGIALWISYQALGLYLDYKKTGDVPEGHHH